MTSNGHRKLPIVSRLIQDSGCFCFYLNKAQEVIGKNREMTGIICFGVLLSWYMAVMNVIQGGQMHQPGKEPEEVHCYH